VGSALPRRSVSPHLPVVAHARTEMRNSDT
jgi:hypothetical protein